MPMMVIVLWHVIAVLGRRAMLRIVVMLRMEVRSSVAFKSLVVISLAGVALIELLLSLHIMI